MKKFGIGFFMLSLFVFAGCQNTPPIEETPPIQEQIVNKEHLQINAESLFGPYQLTQHYSEKMQQPDFEQMDNKDAIQAEIYNKSWEVAYQLKAQEIAALVEAQNDYSCEAEEIGLLPYGSSRKNLIVLDPNTLHAGDSIQVKGNYQTLNQYPLPQSMIQQLQQQGLAFGAFPSDFFYPSYEQDYGTFLKEEWIDRITRIGGSALEYERAPFNTLLISNDLLLHTFHKIFSNELQYFEESQARQILSQLSSRLFDLFKQQKSKNPEEQTIYDFLTAYWAIPHALLIDNETFLLDLRAREQRKREDSYNRDEEQDDDLSDEALKEYLNPRFEEILSQVAPDYQDALKNSWEAIWAATDPKATDYLLDQFSPEYIRDQEIQQDYTQFKPRSHYTNSSFLKTYFMGMKWLMREKLYFGDPKLAEAALTMVASIPKTELTELMQLQDAILQLIGSDDDANIQDLQNFIKAEKWKVGTTLSPEALEKLQELGNQRIISTSYNTPEVGGTDEEAAKDMTRGFVFFGEKFTLDSYIFDLLTAGTAEKEFLEKPNMQTALIVPDLLESHQPAHQLVQLWLQNKFDQKLVFEEYDCEIGICKQISSYPAEKEQTKIKVREQLKDPNLLTTVYHQWLKMLGYLFAPVENLPYFKTLPQYLYKNLLSYMGSYTELKHDTLLYVKQAYAEMGGGGPDFCNITVYPPALPVPKGYVEADVNFIDQLLQLNASMQQRFDEPDNFEGFAEYLKQIRAISEKQMQNQTISDEEFEQLRLSYTILRDLTYPRKLFGEASSKLERGALIADIFTSEGGNPLYEAVGRPMLMAVMIDDANGSRVVMGPIFTHYEFYASDNILESEQRYTDELWQEAYDHLSDAELEASMGLEMKKMLETNK